VRERRERDDGEHEPSSRNRFVMGTETVINASLQRQLVHAYIDNLHEAVRDVNRDRAIASTNIRVDRSNPTRLSAPIGRAMSGLSKSAATRAGTAQRSTRRSRP